MSHEHIDVLIVGAGLSGIGAGYYVQTESPQRSYAILEARDAIGGTWDLFRYPGVRSDSDMYTLGYRFRPWPDARTLADGPAIREYVHETARIHGIDEKIRFGHRVERASWSSERARWEVEAVRTEGGERVRLSANFLFMCSGYYRYDRAYAPEFPGAERFRGEIVHPQFWPEDLDHAGKRVIVIGSGATAVTLVPAMAESAAHVTMLQRSPSYVVSLPWEDPVAKFLRRILPNRWAYGIARWKNVALQTLVFQLSRRRPRFVSGLIRRGVERQLPPDYDIDLHFRPRYNPWDQRMCLVPDGDLFAAIGSGRASVATDTIEAFTETGIRLSSGEELAADIIVTATGLELVPLGGMEIAVDGERVEIPERLTYKGLMLSGVPNFAIAVGYTNASWTLKCELTAEYVCRLLNHMDANGYDTAVPVNDDPSLVPEPLIDFNSGYVLRAIDQFPKQGPEPPWRLYQNYARDILFLRRGPIDDGVLRFSRAAAPATDQERIAA